MIVHVALTQSRVIDAVACPSGLRKIKGAWISEKHRRVHGFLRGLMLVSETRGNRSHIGLQSTMEGSPQRQRDHSGSEHE